MGKVLEFKSARREVKKSYETFVPVDQVDDPINAIINDHSLTVANRHWLLENLLMDIDDQLEVYRRELELAENKLDTLVKSAEQEIAAAYLEFNAQLGVMTSAVLRLTSSVPIGSLPDHAARRPGSVAELPDPQNTVH